MMLAALLTAAIAMGASAPSSMATVGPARFIATVGKPGAEAVHVQRFLLDVDLVTRADFAAFLQARPGWRRGSAKALFVDERYLADWPAPASPGELVSPRAPMTHVSWFAARAYCASKGKRLPTTNEWELAAAASTTKKDARADPAFAAVILGWYARPTTTTTTLPAVGSGSENAWGIRDAHGLVWEWVEDYGAALVRPDARGDDAKDVILFCGGAGSSAVDPSDYASFMRLAFRSSLDARFALPLLGFRCAKDFP